jgi:hypothetical protein
LLEQENARLFRRLERLAAELREASRRAIRNPGTVTLPRDLKSPYS